MGEFLTPPSFPFAVGSIPIQGSGGQLTSDSGLTFNTTTKVFAITPYMRLAPTAGTNTLQIFTADPTRAGWTQIKSTQSAGPTTDFSAQIVASYAFISNGNPQGNNYFNPSYQWGATDGTNTARSYALGSEGLWTNAGGFTQQRLYLWQFDTTGANGRSVFYIDLTKPNSFIVGGGDASNILQPMDLELVSGIVIGGGALMTAGSPPASGTVLGGKILPVVVKSTNATVTYPIWQIKPTLNFTGSNANTTVNFLDIDSTNTSLTGSPTVNLIRAAYGGTLVFNLASDGKTTIAGATARSNLNVWTNFTMEYTASDAVGSTTIFQKSRGTVGAEALINSADVIGSILWRGYDGSSTYASYNITSARIRALATEGFTDSGSTNHHGAKLEFGTIPAGGSVTLTNRLTIDENGLTLTDAHNIITGTTTGMKIGTGTTQKLGFWNATPVVQPTVTGSRAGNAALASLLTALASEGLIVDSSSA